MHLCNAADKMLAAMLPCGVGWICTADIRRTSSRWEDIKATTILYVVSKMQVTTAGHNVKCVEFLI